MATTRLLPRQPGGSPSPGIRAVDRLHRDASREDLHGEADLPRPAANPDEEGTVRGYRLRLILA